MDEPVFEIVTVRPELVAPVLVSGKAMGLGEIDTAGTAGATPVPVRVSVMLTAPAETVKVAVSEVRSIGVKVRFTVQEALAASVPPFAHVPVAMFVKSAAFAPVSV